MLSFDKDATANDGDTNGLRHVDFSQSVLVLSVKACVIIEW